MADTVRPWRPETARWWVTRWAGEYLAADAVVTLGQKGAIRGHLCTAIPNAELRHRVLGWVFGEWGQPVVPMKTGELEDCKWMALKRWIDASPDYPDDPKSKWTPCLAFTTEIEWCTWEKEVKNTAPVQTVMSAVDTAVALGGVVVEENGVRAVPAPQKPVPELVVVRPLKPVRALRQNVRGEFSFD